MAKKIISKGVDSLTLDPNNARKHSDESVRAIAASLERFGQQTPIVIDASGLVVKGNGTLMAAMQLGWDKVDTVLTTLTAQELTAYAIADNRTGELSEWNNERLLEQLESFEDAALQAATGWSEADIIKLCNDLSSKPEIDPDPDNDDILPPIEPTAKAGNVWVLGNHRLMCGDSTKPEDVAKLLNGKKPFLMVTDPPYGVKYDPTRRTDREQRGNAHRERQIPKWDRAEREIPNDDNADWVEAYRLSNAQVAYVWHADKKSDIVASGLREAGYTVNALIVWVKDNITLNPSAQYHYKHEGCWYASKPGVKGGVKWTGGTKQTTVWEIPKPMKLETGHASQKPIECMARPVKNHGTKADLVYDAFGGSGTTLLACEQLGRTCYMMELDPAYCDIVVARWEKMTGLKAELEQ